MIDVLEVMSGDLSRLESEYLEFIEKRGWGRFHTPKSTAMSIAIEASELMEVFQWHDNLNADEYDEKIRAAVKDELADVLIYSLSLADQFDIDLVEAVEVKLQENQERFDEETVEPINEDLGRWMKE